MFGFLKKKVKEFVSSLKKHADSEDTVTTEPAEQIEETVGPSDTGLGAEVETELTGKDVAETPEPSVSPEKAGEEPQITEPIGRSEPLGKKRGGKERKKPQVRLSLITKVKTIASREIRLSEKDIEDVLDELELSLLEGDVAYEVAEELVAEIKERLLNKPIRKDRIEEEVREAIRESLLAVLGEQPGFSLPSFVKELGKRPVVIMFVGPNGVGKTTTIAKVAYLLKNNGLTVVMAASDTFRAAAIEQLKVHGEKLGIPVIAKSYGADPASVAYDAVNYAKSKGIDVVLVDTAGRQDTNKNLVQQLRKIKRVSQADYVIFVGESLVGNAIIEQIKGFDEAVPIDGVILTKLDCDVKGGTALSVRRATGKPIIYVGIGQNYDALEPFSPQRIVDNIIS
ncbi:signal recognition particle-docking protein FtsY [Candidatus Micrarchaeota archaeon]|nr:signal recognition particle-docking protein FtsY [Candidatus Micrarchaeota archaeon]